MAQLCPASRFASRRLEFVPSVGRKLQATGYQLMAPRVINWYPVAKVCQAMPSNLVGWHFAFFEEGQWAFEWLLLSVIFWYC